jgi:Holliday junction resolvase-like predicted endonuclease
MPALISNDDTETCLRNCLMQEGYILNNRRALGETGVDIIARKNGEIVFVEVIGFKQSPSARAKDFYEVFFRSISRVTNGARHCVIALPRRSGLGLPARARHYGEAWPRIGAAVPELEIWLVDTEARSYRRTTWNEWANSSSRN